MTATAITATANTPMMTRSTVFVFLAGFAGVSSYPVSVPAGMGWMVS